MPPLLLRDSSAPLRLLRLYSSRLSLSLSTSVLLFPWISAPCLSTIRRSLLMSLHLHYRFYQLMCEDEPEDRYGVEEQRGVWRKRGEALKLLMNIISIFVGESDIQKNWKMESVAIPEQLIKLLPVAEPGIFDLVGYVIFPVEGIHTRASSTTETLR
ncbi:hypothetical protein IGI04_039857 [Brassica rapa subsp. trilocularis]|uniref:Uncharacterized protein n=1 Tax=Brassica rapa subsp. trilocularis TaxID=1813537 RepID=A0ABQ7KQ72_BRACM|nr:hypothetical protein IGI04_039857 [Brassica rapa subsp. trilocularis]